MRLLLPFSVALLLVGCVFDHAGIGAWDSAALDGSLPDSRAPDLGDAEASDSADGSPTDLPHIDVSPTELGPDTADSTPPDLPPTDQAAGDLPVPDLPVPDLPVPDLPVPDLPWPPDQGAIVPISSTALGNALDSTTVPCVMYDGSTPGGSIPVADSTLATMFDGSVTLAGADQPTKTWVGGQPSVIVVWNPNSCDWEDPANYASNWSTAGLLVRGATLNTSGEMVLAPGTTAADINTLNVNADGTFQVDYFEPDDSKLTDYPNLVNPVNKAKQLILQLGNV